MIAIRRKNGCKIITKRHIIEVSDKETGECVTYKVDNVWIEHDRWQSLAQKEGERNERST